MSETRPITPAGYKRYEDELQRLWHEDRPKIVQEVSDAAALGDRSENAEYIYGKKKLREIDRRMKFLSELLDKLVIVEPKSVSSDKVEFGATVHLVDDEGKPRRYQIVGQDEVDAKLGLISGLSPVGKALMGKRVGDIVLIQRPAGDLEVEVTRIEYV